MKFDVQQARELCSKLEEVYGPSESFWFATNFGKNSWRYKFETTFLQKDKSRVTFLIENSVGDRTRPDKFSARVSREYTWPVCATKLFEATPSYEGQVPDTSVQEGDSVDTFLKVFVQAEQEVTEKYLPKRVDYDAKEKTEKAKKARRVKLSEVFTPGPVTLTEWSYYPGDKRSCGSLELTVKTVFGELGVALSFGSSGGSEAEATFTLNGKEAVLGDLDLPDFGVPHYYQGKTLVEEFETNGKEKLEKVLTEWLS